MDDIKTKSKVQKVENNTTNNQRQEIVNHITLYDTINEFGASRTIECIVIDDETKEPIPFANVTFADNGINISGCITDFDGKFTILSVPEVDSLIMKVSYVGYKTESIDISEGFPSVISLQVSAMQIQEVLMVRYNDRDETITSEEIARMPGRDASSVATTVGGVYSEDGQIGSIRGSRTEGTATFVDGIRLLSPKYETLNKSKSTIKVLSWMPHAPYMEELRKANDDELLAIYYKLKDENKNRPSFYIQVADLFFVKGKHKQAVRILSNTIELDLENPELLKVVARRLLDEKEYEMSIKIFTEIKDLRPEEPQSYRDLALAYTKNKQYQKALDMHLHILNRKWGRFEEIKEVVFNEFNWLIALHGKDLDLSEVNKDYIKSMPLDIRISIDWSSNNNDIDLWVVDPNGEKCYYKNRFTKIGGKLSKDFTQGYGPEEFSIKKAKRGFYTIYVNYYSESRQSITGPVTVYAELITHYGTDKQKTERIAIQLENDSSKKTVQIGQLEFNE